MSLPDTPHETGRELDSPSPVRPDVCPVEDWLAFLGHRWNALILWHLKATARRNHELAALLPGISPKVLSERLSGLERRRLVSKTESASFPRTVHYALTPRAQALLPILDQAEAWARAEG